MSDVADEYRDTPSIWILAENKGGSDLICQEGSVLHTQELLSLAKWELVDILWEAEQSFSLRIMK